MNNEILELAKKTKESIQSLKYNHYFEDVPINQDQLLLICEYIVGINSLKPIGYMSVTGVENIHDCGSSTVHEESDDKRNIPVYIQY
ncbi:hypothetical protein AB7185_06810 [Providencia rettgeri]